MMTPILNSLPPGFRFHPTDSELILYLNNKVSSSPLISIPSIISEIDLYKLNPWELPEEAYFGDNEWFCFSPRVRKYPNGVRPNRRAATGYWKATGTDKPILSSLMQCVGVKKSLIFYKGRAPKGTKTNWIMHEYRLRNSTALSNRSMILDGWVLCRIRHKRVTAEAFKEEGGDKDACSFELEGYGESINGATQNDVVYDGTGECSKAASLKDALEGIKRVLSLGALDEQQAAEWPNNRSCDASANCTFNIPSI